MRDYIISSVQETNLTNKNGVYQDSLIAYDRDASGRIWAILDRKSTRLNSSHNNQSRMPSSA